MKAKLYQIDGRIFKWTVDTIESFIFHNATVWCGSVGTRAHAALGVVATAAHIISVCLLDAFCIMDPYFGHQLLYMTTMYIY